MQCTFCQDNISHVDYKNTALLRKFVTSEFKLKPAQRNHLCDKHQRKVANAVKVSRFMALMPYTRNQTIKKSLVS